MKKPNLRQHTQHALYRILLRRRGVRLMRHLNTAPRYYFWINNLHLGPGRETVAYSNSTLCTRKASTLPTTTHTSSSRVCSPSTGRMFSEFLGYYADSHLECYCASTNWALPLQYVFSPNRLEIQASDEVAQRDDVESSNCRGETVGDIEAGGKLRKEGV